ncbi:uncharacterized protein KQ657_003128 [Scheffersomyces spartinae]|uniref:FAD-binding FR-type domain-containing protein n=1 Tax=Scheffersomyces spartinae TaxID=45513 RepID=A0A9P7V4Z6_9ASCO|nr:uncharacterized protein KQ657_003128 [Scheffersomyces spartinae]KAG7191452.1 hypothetical protein KQ657_003128 [Scheffersomyces spartinae]
MRLTGPISNNFRKYILLPATYGKKRNQELSWLGKLIFMLIPLRWETLVICVFLVLNFVLLFANLYYVENDPLFPTKKGAFNKYVGDRSGIGGTMLTPMLVLFAGRNNILLWLTGWNYATNITFHKWVSRISFLLILIHSICYTVIFVGRGDYKEEMKETYLIWGTVGTAVMGLIMLQAMLQFRRRWYETFVLFHILLAVFYIIGCWYHLADLGYLQMIIPAIALWGFDRVARLVRMFIYGFPEACVTLLGNGNGIDPLTKEAATLKVVVPKSDHWRMSPGGHVWIYFLKPTCFWQSHPFTCIESLDGKSIILYCKVKSGVTYNLFKYLLVSPTKEAKIRVSVEGPYSEPCQYKRTECVSFIAGGNGIPGLYSEVTHLAKKRQPSKGKLKLHWIIRDYGSIMWFYEQLEALKDVQVETTIYLTKPSQTLAHFDSNKDTDDDDAEKKSRESVSLDIAHLKSCLSHINFVEGKPLVDDIIRNDLEETSKSVAFVACGHPMMVDDARYALVQSLTQNKGKRVDFYEALQVWT